MNAVEWKERAQERLRRFAVETDRWSAGLLYGGLAASAVFPLVEATSQAVATGNLGLLLSVGSLAGSLVGGNLLAERISRWHGRTEAEIAAEMTAQTAADPAWRDALDELLLALEAPRIVQAVLPEREWDRFQRMLQSELAKLGNSQKYAETVFFDQREQRVAGNQQNISGRVDGPVVGGNVEQIGDRHYYPPALDPAATAAATARQRYLRGLHRRCNVLPLAPLGGEESAGDEVTLDQVYVELDTQSRVKLTAAEKEEIKKRQGRVSDDANRPVSVLEAAGRSRRLVLLGDPGSGKSTFVRQLCAWQSLALLGEPLPVELPGAWPKDLLPLFTVIREVAGELAALPLAGLAVDEQDRLLVDALWGNWQKGLVNERAADFADDLADRLERGSALVVLDGLDEAPVEQRPAVVRAIAALQRRYPKLARLIVTCRVRSYTDAVRLDGFAVQTLAPFDREKIQRFVYAWYGAQARQGRFDSETANARSDDLAQAALSDHLRELSPNPMLLTTMAIVHQKETKLPRERVRLYAKTVEVLVERWQKHRGLAIAPGLAALFADENRLRRVLERLAYEAHRTKQKEVDLPRSQLLGILEEAEFLGDAGLASDFLDYVDQRAGLLVGQGGDGSSRRPQSYAFPHRTFQEYLAGCYLVGGRGVRRAYWEKVGEGDYWYLAGMYGAEELLHNRRNEQALLDLAYDLCPNAQPDDERGWRALVWSGQMAALLGADAIRRDTAGPDGGGVYLERVKRGLKALLAQTHLTPLERAEGGRALGLLGDPRKGVGVVETRRGVSLPDIDWVKIPETDAQGRREFIYQKNERRVEPTFWMARYPITYAQFQTFIDAPDGWRNPLWWEGLSVPAAQRTEPSKQRFPVANHPRENVSWYQAVAFCRRLTEQYRRQPELLPAALAAGAGWRVSLPTEWQWEKAARGHDGREYPWGNGYRSGYANVDETGGNAGPHYLASTSAVGIYPQGASPYRILDLSGNVWEWCLNEYDNPERIQAAGDASRVVRGGAWYRPHDSAAAAFRYWHFPDYWGYHFGFRVVWSASVPVPSL